MGFGVWGLGFGVWGLGFGVWGLGFRIEALNPDPRQNPVTPKPLSSWAELKALLGCFSRDSNTLIGDIP